MGQIEKRLTSIEDRLKKLEKAVFENKPGTKIVSEDFSSLSGGIRFLIKNGFFKTPKSSSEVMSELKRENYYHSLAALTTALSRDFTRKQKILTRFKEGNVFKYAERK